jgi:ABC-2 type transport system ATP-binding protein
MDSRAVVITPAQPLASAPGLGPLEGKLRPDGRLAITYKPDQSSFEDVMAAVRQAGVTIKDLATEDPDLEDVFLALTYGDPNAADPTKD